MISKIFLIRVSANLLLFLSLVLAPWWLTLVLAVLTVFVFDNFYEIIFLGFCFDLLYGPGRQSTGLLLNLAGLLSATLIFLCVALAKTRLIVYNR